MKVSPEIIAQYPRLGEMVAVVTKRGGDADFWDDHIYSNLTIIDAAPGKLTWEFEVEDMHCNQLGTWHGGCVATVIDACTSIAIAVYEGKTKWVLSGVSTELAVSYMRGIPSGETARVECEVHRVGKSLANLFAK
ncbi:hypothetical protein DFQ28_011017, partial [Apophysomyces sp. BC1034]